MNKYYIIIYIYVYVLIIINLIYFYKKDLKIRKTFIKNIRL